MALDISKLENVQNLSGKVIARCPACARKGKDRKGIHLCIFPDGKYGCVAFQNDKEHSRDIFRLVGSKTTPKSPIPAPSFWKLAGIRAPYLDLEQYRFRTVRTGISKLRGQDKTKQEVTLAKRNDLPVRSAKYPSGPSEVEQWLWSKFELIEWNSRRARKIVESLEPSERSKESTEACRWNASLAAEKMQRKEYRFSPRSAFGRITTSLTSLRKELRPCVTVNGGPLYSVDLKNSQPLLVGILARIFYGSEKGRQRLLKGDKFEPALLNQTKPETEPPDLRDYAVTAERGGIFAIVSGENREESKKAVYKFLFAKSQKSEVSEIVGKKWPSVKAMLWSLKKRDHRKLKRLLQSLEAYIFLDRIAAKLMERVPELPVFTAHDAILTTKEHTRTVQRAIRREFRKLSINSPLKITRW